MTTKHTPAPWYLKETIYNDYRILANGYLVAEISKDCLSEEVMKANAKLIAAAPDLLDALIGMINLYPFPASYNLKPAIEKARVAIEKATT